MTFNTFITLVHEFNGALFMKHVIPNVTPWPNEYVEKCVFVLFSLANRDRVSEDK